jgi:superoxide dismutase, Cu-Zn family
MLLPQTDKEKQMNTTSTSPRRSRSRSRSRSRTVAWTSLGTAVLVGAATFAAADGSASGGGWEGVAVLHDASGNKVGKVKFEGNEHGTVVKATVNGVTVGLDGYHGFHVHSNDAGGPCNPQAASGPFTNVGGHWNPSGALHAGHAGDLPSIQILADGTGNARSLTGRFDPSDIEGRAVILHAGPDNFGNIPTRYVTGTPAVAGPDATTSGTGDAGGRIACGIVELD